MSMGGTYLWLETQDNRACWQRSGEQERADQYGSAVSSH
jgi:hypothetical protein